MTKVDPTSLFILQVHHEKSPRAFHRLHGMRYDPDETDQCDGRGKTRAQYNVIPRRSVVTKHPLGPGCARSKRESRYDVRFNKASG